MKNSTGPSTRSSRSSLDIAVVYSRPTENARQCGSVLADSDTRDSAEEVAAALKAKGSAATLHGVTPDTLESILSLKCGCIFNLIDWTGHDLPAARRAFENFGRLQIPVTGADWDSFYLSSDKILMKRRFDAGRIPTPNWYLYESGTEIPSGTIPFPHIVKLAFEHSGIGLTHDSLVSDAAAEKEQAGKLLAKYRQPVIAEEFIPGRELQVTAYEKNGDVIILPIAEQVFVPDASVRYITYDGRWDENHADYSATRGVLAALDTGTGDACVQICRKAFRDLNLSGYVRFDIRLRSDGSPAILEFNANPGLFEGATWGTTISYHAAGLTFADFVRDIVEGAKPMRISE